MKPEEFIRPKDAAKILKLSPSTLAKMRISGDGPIYTKAGPKMVLYCVKDLTDWLVSRNRRSTSE